MNTEEILIVHKYLMEEWKINQPKGPRGEKGDIGPKGPRGDGFDIIKWMPKFVVSEFRKNEEYFCFMITDPGIDLVKDQGGNYTKWKSRSNEKKYAEAVSASKVIQKIKDGQWALDLTSSASYNIKGASLWSTFVCVTYKLNVAPGSTEQFIFQEKTRGLSTTGNHIYIYGVDNKDNKLKIQYHTPRNVWNTIFVSWVANHEGRFVINGHMKKTGTFSCDKKYTSSGQISLGIALTPLKGAIAVFEGCKIHHNGMIPDKIIDLLMDDQRL